MDFLFEARNSEKCLENFKRLSPHIADCIYAPKVYWDLSTSKVLTMEYMDAAEITDLITIQKLGIQLSDVSKLVKSSSHTFYAVHFLAWDLRLLSFFQKPCRLVKLLLRWYLGMDLCTVIHMLLTWWFALCQLVEEVFLVRVCINCWLFLRPCSRSAENIISHIQIIFWNHSRL